VYQKTGLRKKKCGKEIKQVQKLERRKKKKREMQKD